MVTGTPEYSIQATNDHRLAVTHSGGRIVLGHVFENADGTWSIELKGKTVEVLFASLRCAAKAIIDVSPVVN